MLNSVVKYSIKVWLISVFISPLLWGISEIYFSSKWNYVLNFGGFYFFAILYGLVLSIPILIIFIFLNWLIAKKTNDSKTLKTTSSIISFLLILIICFVYFGQDDKKTWFHTFYQIPIFYSITSILGIWLVKTE